MTSTTETLPAETGGTDITRFNALRHGVLSRYTVLPWEDASEYHTLLAALVAEHAEGEPLVDFMMEELYSFTGESWEQEDDITMVTLQRVAL